MFSPDGTLISASAAPHCGVLMGYSGSALVLKTRRHFSKICVHAGSSSRGGDVTVYVKDINQPSLPTPFYSVLVSVSVFMALSTVFHCINSPDNSPFFSLSSSGLISALVGPFNCMSLYESLLQP